MSSDWLLFFDKLFFFIFHTTSVLTSQCMIPALVLRATTLWIFSVASERGGAGATNSSVDPVDSWVPPNSPQQVQQMHSPLLLGPLLLLFA